LNAPSAVLLAETPGFVEDVGWEEEEELDDAPGCLEVTFGIE